MDCVGKQESLIDMRETKARKFRELKKGSREYTEWFLKYNPAVDADPLRGISEKEFVAEEGEKGFEKKMGKKSDKRPETYKKKLFRGHRKTHYQGKPHTKTKTKTKKIRYGKPVFFY